LPGRAGLFIISVRGDCGSTAAQQIEEGTANPIRAARLKARQLTAAGLEKLLQAWLDLWLFQTSKKTNTPSDRRHIARKWYYKSGAESLSFRILLTKQASSAELQNLLGNLALPPETFRFIKKHIRQP